MATLADILRERLAERQAQQPNARELERINNPRRYAARLRAEAYRRKKCPLRKLAVITQQLKDFRAPLTAKAEALRGLREFGGNISRHLVYHLIDKHRRGTSFTPLVQQFLRDYKEAHELDHTLTREQFISTYTDQIVEFLSSYTLTAEKLNAVRIEYLTLRVLVSIVAPSREKYSAQFEAACLLVSQAETRFNTLCKRQILKTKD